MWGGGGAGDKNYRTPLPHPTTPTVHVQYGGIIALFKVGILILLTTK